MELTNKKEGNPCKLIKSLIQKTLKVAEKHVPISTGFRLIWSFEMLKYGKLLWSWGYPAASTRLSTSHDQDLIYLRRQQEIYLVFHDTQKFDSAHQTRNHKSQAVKIKRQILEHERFTFVQTLRTQRWAKQVQLSLT